MADPISITASVVAIVTAAVQSVKSLHNTVSCFKGRDKTLQRLQNELHDIENILNSLTEVVHAEASMSALLQGPIDRCSKICQEFEQSMKSFGQKSKASFRDWTKLEFMRGDINEFIDTLSGYKSTISVGIGTITIRTAKVSQQTLEEYNEMIQDTTYELNVRLQRIDEKLQGLNDSKITTSSVSLDDEKEVTESCLRICEDAARFLESLKQNPVIFQKLPNTIVDEEQNSFGAQLLTRQALDENQESFANIIDQLRKRLESVILENNPDNEKERSRLLDDINVSKQCLEVCKVASEVSSKKVYRVGEAIADGDSDQVVVTTLADLFDVKRAISKGRSAQLVGSMTEAALRDMTEKRYGSRFGAFAQDSNLTEAPTSTTPIVRTKTETKSSPHQTNIASHTQSKLSHGRPSPNEMRRRMTWDEEHQVGRK